MRIENLICAEFANIIHESDFEIESYIGGVVRLKNVCEDAMDELEVFFAENEIPYDMIKTSETRYLVIAK